MILGKDYQIKYVNMSSEEIQKRIALVGKDWTDYDFQAPEGDWRWFCYQVVADGYPVLLDSFVKIERVRKIVENFETKDGVTAIYCEPCMPDEMEMFRDEKSWMT